MCCRWWAAAQLQDSCIAPSAKAAVAVLCMSTMTVLDRWTYISRCRFGALGVAVGFPLADPIVGILISIVILFVLKGAVTAIYHCMMDAVDPSLVDRVETDSSLR
jgi:divalent metal cation (Fe/Co/Zn/Cd) transporter